MRKKLTILNYAQQKFHIDIDDEETVLALKQRLYMLPEVVSPPELQRLIYNGQIIRNHMPLSHYDYDERKKMVIMILPHMEKIMDEMKAAADGEPMPDTGPTVFKKPLSNTTKYALKSKHEKHVENIVNMGYPEDDVRRALRASFDNPERAIEYLVDGIPDSPSTPEGNTSDAYTSDSTEISPFEFLRTDPSFRRLRRSIIQNPQFLDTAVRRMGELNPQVLRFINENREEFLSMLFEPSDDEDDGEGSESEEASASGGTKKSAGKKAVANGDAKKEVAKSTVEQGDTKNTEQGSDMDTEDGADEEDGSNSAKEETVKGTDAGKTAKEDGDKME